MEIPGLAYKNTSVAKTKKRETWRLTGSEIDTNKRRPSVVTETKRNPESTD